MYRRSSCDTPETASRLSASSTASARSRQPTGRSASSADIRNVFLLACVVEVYVCPCLYSTAYVYPSWCRHVPSMRGWLLWCTVASLLPEVRGSVPHVHWSPVVARVLFGDSCLRSLQCTSLDGNLMWAGNLL